MILKDMVYMNCIPNGDSFCSDNILQVLKRRTNDISVILGYSRRDMTSLWNLRSADQFLVLTGGCPVKTGQGGAVISGLLLPASSVPCKPEHDY